MDGVWLCAECGDLAPDPQDAFLLEAIGRLVDRKFEALREELGGHAPSAAEPQDEPEGWIGAEETGTRLNLSARSVRANYQKLGGQRWGDGPRPRYYFDPEHIERIRRGTATLSPTAEATPGPNPRRRRPRKSSTVELLPIGPPKRNAA
jgi:hypothetical protein